MVSLYVIGADLTVPFFTVILRKAYGLGAQAMAGGGFHAPFFAVSWPIGEFGGMGLEGALKLGYRNGLAAIAGPSARKRLRSAPPPMPWTGEKHARIDAW